MLNIEVDPRNREAVESLVKAFRRRQGIIPFVGTGLSYDWGFLLWGRFLIEAAGRAGREAEVRRALEESDFELAAQIIEGGLGRAGFNKLITEVFGRAVHPQQQPSAAVHLLPRLATGPVITTNFDSVLETVFKAAGHAFDLPPL